MTNSGTRSGPSAVAQGESPDKCRKQSGPLQSDPEMTAMWAAMRAAWASGQPIDINSLDPYDPCHAKPDGEAKDQQEEKEGTVR